MKFVDCAYVLYVHNKTFTRRFRKGFMTLRAARRNLINYKIAGFHGELHNNFMGVVIENF